MDKGKVQYVEDLGYVIERYNELIKILDCGDSSCPFKKKNEHGQYGMRTNGGCRCFQDINPHQKRRAVERLIRAIGMVLDEHKR